MCVYKSTLRYNTTKHFIRIIFKLSQEINTALQQQQIIHETAARRLQINVLENIMMFKVKNIPLKRIVENIVMFK